MFKQRIAEWNLRKNCTSRQESEFQNDEVQLPSDGADAPSSPTKQLRNHRKRSTRTAPTNTQSSSTPSPQSTSSVGRTRKARKSHKAYLELHVRSLDSNLSLSRIRAISEELNNLETLLTLIDHYYDSFFHAAWKRTYPCPPRFAMREMPLCVNVKRLLNHNETPIVVHPTSLFSRYHIAVVLFKNNTPEASRAGWKFIQQAFEILQATIVQQHPRLLSGYLEQFYSSLYDAHPDLMRQLFHFSAENAKIQFGDRHPITQFCRLLPRFGNKLDVIQLVWKRLHESFDAKLGISHEEVLRSKISLCGVFIERKQFAEAEQLLQFILRNHERPPTDYWVRAARCRLGWLYVEQQRYSDAEEVLVDLLQQYRGCEGNEDVSIDAIYIASLSLLARSNRERKQYKQAEIILNDACHFCVPLFGREHGYSISVLYELEQLKRSRAAEAEIA